MDNRPCWAASPRSRRWGIGLEGLGLELDATANGRCRPDADVAAPGSRGRILLIATREDLMIVREAVRVLGPANPSVTAGGGKSAS
jgi:acetate kinase